jgi:hypothetical protein
MLIEFKEREKKHEQDRENRRRRKDNKFVRTEIIFVVSK